jgi:hypothetical protein
VLAHIGCNLPDCSHTAAEACGSRSTLNHVYGLLRGHCDPFLISELTGLMLPPDLRHDRGVKGKGMRG